METTTSLFRVAWVPNEGGARQVREFMNLRVAEGFYDGLIAAGIHLVSTPELTR